MGSKSYSSAFPLFATGFLAIVLAVGLLFSGIARIVQVVSSKNGSKESPFIVIIAEAKT